MSLTLRCSMTYNGFLFVFKSPFCLLFFESYRSVFFFVGGRCFCHIAFCLLIQINFVEMASLYALGRGPGSVQA
jgi:hypothetical protein